MAPLPAELTVPAPHTVSPSTHTRWLRAQRGKTLMALALALSWGCAAQRPQGIASIAEARHLPLGSVVAVGGAVTVPAGLFQSATGDEGFAIQDQTAGIYVSVPVNTGVESGQAIGVTGSLADRHGLLTLMTLAERDVVRFASGTVFTPERVKTGSIGESTEGRLVQISGTVLEPVRDDLPYGYRFVVSDGSGPVRIFVHASTGIEVDRVRKGQRVDVTGFSGQYGSTHEVWPRFSTDLRAAQEPNRPRHAPPRH